MTKFILPMILAILPSLLPSSASAVRPRKAVICGHLFKAVTFSFKSTPVIYMVTSEGRSFTLYPQVGSDTPDPRFSARLALLEKLSHMEVACLNGLAYNETFVADALVDRSRTAIAKQEREQRQRQQRQQAQASARQRPQAQQTAAARPRNTDWVPWNPRNPHQVNP